MSEPLKHIDDLFRENQHQFDKRPSTAAWSRLDTMLDQVEDKEVNPKPKPKANYRIWLSIAAMLFLCLGGWWMSQSLLTSNNGDKAMAESRNVSAPMTTEVETEKDTRTDKENKVVDLANEPINVSGNNGQMAKKTRVKEVSKPVGKVIVAKEIIEEKREETLPAVLEIEEADVAMDNIGDTDYSDEAVTEEVIAYADESLEEEKEAEAIQKDEVAVVAPSVSSNTDSRSAQTFKIQPQAENTVSTSTTVIPQIIWMEGIWATANGAIVLEISQKDSKTYEVIWKENGKTIRSIAIEAIDGNPLSIQVHQHNAAQTSYDFVLAEANESYNTLRFKNDDAFIKLKSLMNGDLRWTEKSPFGKKMYMFELQ